MKLIQTLFLFLLFTGSHAIFAQETSRGPIIKDYGNVFKVANQDLRIDTKQSYKVVFDVGRTFKDNNKTNPLIETAARFLNMHAQNGLSINNMDVALVIHGDAAFDILNNAHYKKKYGSNNPNTPLIAALKEAGVHIVICGQTAASYKITREKTLPQVQFALSAMTALIHYQNNEYRLINF